MRALHLLLPSVVAVTACGSRTGLLVGTDLARVSDDASPPPLTVTTDGASPTQCADASATLIYVVTEQSNLYSFDPNAIGSAASPFARIGPIVCPPGPNGASMPFSMAVDSAGIAYVVFESGDLYRVSVANAACALTSFVPGQMGFSTRFGMGFAQNGSGIGETLYVASDDDGGAGASSQLGSIDISTFALRSIGTFVPFLNSAELTGTGAGELFAFFAPADCAGSKNCAASVIAQVDPATAQVIGQSGLPFGQGIAWAFAFWGGDFYTFTATPAGQPGSDAVGATVVHLFRPADGTIVAVADGPIGPAGPELVVGAGVSTCAPQE
jgi:hypothetical protein